MSDNRILLGFEVGTGKEVQMRLHHTVVTGMTQLSGKTTTLEAIISRSGKRAIAFKAKRGEEGFNAYTRSCPSSTSGQTGSTLPASWRRRSGRS